MKSRVGRLLLGLAVPLAAFFVVLLIADARGESPGSSTMRSQTEGVDVDEPPVPRDFALTEDVRNKYVDQEVQTRGELVVSGVRASDSLSEASDAESGDPILVEPLLERLYVPTESSGSRGGGTAVLAQVWKYPAEAPGQIEVENLPGDRIAIGDRAAVVSSDAAGNSVIVWEEESLIVTVRGVALPRETLEDFVDGLTIRW